MRKVFRNDSERSIWLQDLVSLLEEGFSLSESLSLMKELHTYKKAKFCADLYKGLIEGSELSTQLKSGGFTNEIVSYLYFSEKYGNLIEGLSNVKEILRKRNETVRKTAKMISYPVFLSFIIIIMAIVMAEGVFPHFEQYFTTIDHQLPYLTKLVIALLSAFNPMTIALTIIGLLLTVLLLKRKPYHDRLYFVLKIPFLRTFIRSLVTYYVAAQLAPMLKHGLSLQRSLQIMSEESSNLFFQREATSISYYLLEGETLSEVLRSRGYYEPHFASIVALGERKGRLGQELERYSSYLFQNLYEDIQRKVAIAQPMILSAVGLIILIIFLSMMLPIFHMIDAM
ncbi:competence type IV pilus assembly protein ComGB [Evansella halocellulosilytica]|uniref:competence type IV pilus assembly protein ComGB n=1 Tax=Evansella halocellulosilytica TaxID=2011013 RepID=UPI000BB6BD35|nr:competence type IV pilus assembly protein ComGB [Evansella halocellulosilytica]